MYDSLFQFIFGFASFTGNFFLDSLIVTLLSAALHSWVFAIVGHLYASGIIEGSKAGKIAYGILFIGTMIGVVYLINFLRSYWWILLIVFFVALAITVAIILLLRKRNQKKAKLIQNEQ